MTGPCIGTMNGAERPKVSVPTQSIGTRIISDFDIRISYFVFRISYFKLSTDETELFGQAYFLIRCN